MSEKEKKSKNVFQTACRLLSRRLHSEKELKTKLLQRGFSADSIDKTIFELRRQKFLDDANFAEIYAEELRGKAVGARKIIMEMKKRGIAEEIIDKFKRDDFAGEDEEIGRARVSLDRRRKTFEREKDRVRRKQKIWRFLSSRGFSASVIEKALSNFGTI